MATVIISVPSVIVNNLPIAIKPNSLKYKEGLGEQNMRVQSAGGGSVEIVYSDNAESKLSMVSFEMVNTSDNITQIRQWKTNLNQNAISIADQNSGFSRTFANMALIADYEVNLGADTSITVEFKGNPAV